MGNKIVAVILFFAAAFLLPFSVYSDYIYLKSGDKIEGEIWKKEFDTVTIAADTQKGIIPVIVSREDIKKTEGSPGRKSLAKTLKKTLYYMEEADKYYNLGLYKQAITFYENITEINPKFYSVYYKLGLAYSGSRLWVQARQNLNTALKLAEALGGKDAEAISFIAKVKMELIKLEEKSKSAK